MVTIEKKKNQKEKVNLITQEIKIILRLNILNN